MITLNKDTVDEISHENPGNEVYCAAGAESEYS